MQCGEVGGLPDRNGKWLTLTALGEPHHHCSNHALDILLKTKASSLGNAGHKLKIAYNSRFSLQFIKVTIQHVR